MLRDFTQLKETLKVCIFHGVETKEEMSQNGKMSKTSPGRSDEQVPIHFAKIIILGDAAVGKTSLIKVKF